MQVKTLGASITIEPDPSKKPSGGVPLFSAPLTDASLEVRSSHTMQLSIPGILSNFSVLTLICIIRSTYIRALIYVCFGGKSRSAKGTLLSA